MSTLVNKELVLITGVSNGLGKELYQKISNNERFNTIGVYRTENEFIESAIQQGKHLLKWDLSDTSMFSSFESQFEAFNNLFLPSKYIFINNAGTIEPIGNLEDFESNEIISTINTNLISSILIAKSIVNYRKSLDIINISSGAAEKAISGWSLYCTTKAAIKMFYDVIAIQYSFIKVEHIDPGVLNTNMQAQIRQKQKIKFPLVDKFIELKEKGLLKETSDVANSILNNYIL